MHRGSIYRVMLLLGLVCVTCGIKQWFFGDTGNASSQLQQPEPVNGGKRSVPLPLARVQVISAQPEPVGREQHSVPPPRAQGPSPQAAPNAIPRTFALSHSPSAREAIELPEVMDESPLPDAIALPVELLALADQPNASEVWPLVDQSTTSEGEIQDEFLQDEERESQLAEARDPSLPDAETIPDELLALVDELDAPE